MPGGASSGGSSGAIRAGKAFVELMLKDNLLTRGLANARAKVMAFGSLIASTVVKIGATGGLLAAPLGVAATAAMKAGGTIGALAKRYHTSTEAVSALAFATKATGGSLEDLASAAEALGNKIFEARDGAAGAIQDFARLGLNAQILEKLPLDERFAAIAAALDKIPEVDDKFKALEMVFGGAGREMAGLFMNGIKGYRALQDEAAKSGAVLDKETTEKLKSASKTITKAWAVIEAIVIQVGAALVPSTAAFQDAGKTISIAAAAAKKWINENKPIIQIAGLLTAGFLVGAAALGAFSVVASVTSGAVGILTSVIGICSAALSILLSPIGVVIGLAVGAGAAFLTMTESGRAMATGLKAAFGQVRQDFTTAWGGISAAMRSGDFGKAAEIAWDFVKLAWARATLYLTQKWNSFKDVIVDSWHDLGFGLSAIWNDIWAGIQTIVIKACGHIVETFLAAVNSIADAANEINSALGGDEAYWKKFSSELGNEGAARAVAKIRKEQADNDKAILDRRNQRLDGARAARMASEDEAQADVDAAKAALARGAAEAIAARQPEVQPAGPGRLSSLGKIPEVPQLAAAVKGAFSGPFRQMLGIGDSVAKRQLMANERAANGIDQLNKQVAGMPFAKFK